MDAGSETWTEPNHPCGMRPLGGMRDASGINRSGLMEEEPSPALAPLSLDTILTMEDLRRLLKIVVYSG